MTLKKKDICAIASTNTSKSLVYQAILVFIGGSVFIISPTIALIENQIRAYSKYYLYISL